MAVTKQLRKVKLCNDKKVLTKPNKVVEIHSCILPKRHTAKHTDGHQTWV